MVVICVKQEDSSSGGKKGHLEGRTWTWFELEGSGGPKKPRSNDHDKNRTGARPQARRRDSEGVRRQHEEKKKGKSGRG